MGESNWQELPVYSKIPRLTHRAGHRIGRWIFQHSKVITGILVGFALTHLLGGLARLIQHQERWRRFSGLRPLATGDDVKKIPVSIPSRLLKKGNYTILVLNGDGNAELTPLNVFQFSED